MLIVGAFSGQPEAIAWARDNLQNRYGPVALESPCFDFTETHYYDAPMGQRLRLQLLGFRQLIDSAALAAVKLATHQAEQEYARRHQAAGGRIVRPLNLDPGYLSLGKWVLATTKDQAHRVYLGEGVFAEVTLRYEHGDYVPWPWTYPNYRRDDYRAFFRAARAVYARLLRGGD
jgi:hypothetical protein